MQNISYLLAPGGIHMVLNKKPVNVARTDAVFEKVTEAIKANATEEEVLAILEAARRRVEDAVVVTKSISLREGTLYFEGKQIGGVLCERMLQMLDEGFDLNPMEQFLRRLYKNPSRRVVEHLYAFLEYGKSPITEDGCFLAYKAVRQDFKDIHSGNFDNSVGAVLEMTRNAVDDNPQVTCSHGFHVCSFNYLPYFANANGHVMICKVDPADVVAIPIDYSNTKMRVCRYEVIGEYEGYYAEQRKDVLAQTSVASLEGKTFSVWADYTGNEDFVLDEAFETLSAAANLAEKLVEQPHIAAVQIRNVRTGQTVMSMENEGFEDDFDESDEESFAVYGFKDGTKNYLEGTFDTVSEALEAAIEYVADDYSEVTIVNERTGATVKSIT